MIPTTLSPVALAAIAVGALALLWLLFSPRRKAAIVRPLAPGLAPAAEPVGRKLFTRRERERHAENESRMGDAAALVEEVYEHLNPPSTLDRVHDDVKALKQAVLPPNPPAPGTPGTTGGTGTATGPGTSWGTTPGSPPAGTPASPPSDPLAAALTAALRRQPDPLNPSP